MMDVKVDDALNTCKQLLHQFKSVSKIEEVIKIVAASQQFLRESESEKKRLDALIVTLKSELTSLGRALDAKKSSTQQAIKDIEKDIDDKMSSKRAAFEKEVSEMASKTDHVKKELSATTAMSNESIKALKTEEEKLKTGVGILKKEIKVALEKVGAIPE